MLKINNSNPKLLNFIFRKVHNFFFLIFSYFILFLDELVPKKKNLIAFAQKNKLFSDNSKAFFQYLVKHHPEYDVIWIVDNLSEKQHIQNKYSYPNVEILYRPQGLYKLIKSKVVVVSNSLDDFFPFFNPSRKKECVQLWHGINWSKKFEFPNRNFTKQITMACASSEENKIQMSKQNHFPLEKIFVTGLPRNDVLFKKGEIIEPDFIKKIKKKIILYAPTHKEDLVNNFFPFEDKNLGLLNDFLVKKNCILYLRPHINDSNKFEKNWEKYFISINQSNIKSLTFNDIQDINEFLPFVKILITDYSTIYADAMLINIPPIFIPYDIDTYIKKRGLIYNFSEVAIGYKALNQKNLIENIEIILNNKFEYWDDLEKVKLKFHMYKDNKSSQRVAKILKAKID